MIAVIVAGGISFLFVLFSTSIGVSYFKSKNIGQPIQEELNFHDHKKGTPTMGGVFIILGTYVGFILSHINLLSSRLVFHGLHSYQVSVASLRGPSFSTLTFREILIMPFMKRLKAASYSLHSLLSPAIFRFGVLCNALLLSNILRISFLSARFNLSII